MTGDIAYTGVEGAGRAKVLVVDDDETITEVVSTSLEQSGYDTYVAANVREARDILSEVDADICVLDILLPGTSGRVFCRELADTRQTAVIIVSSLTADEDRIALLELGADDYLVKPFNPQELLARVRAVLRRRGQRTPLSATIRFGPWTFHRGNRRMFRDDGSSTALTQSECELLRFLLDNPEIVFSREELLAVSRLRQHGGAGDRSVDTLVKRLRRKMEDDPDSPAFIQTVWGRGYRFRPTPPPMS